MIDKNNEIFKRVCGDGFEPSPSQLEIFNFVKYGIGNGSIESRAGSGKSKTIELSTYFIPSNKKVLILAYNVHIANNLKQKLKPLNNVVVYTYHSLGYRLLTSTLNKEIKVDENKYIRYINTHINELLGNFDDFSNAEKGRYIKNLEKLLDYSRYNLMQSEKEIAKMAVKYGVKTFSNECEVVRKLMKWGCENTDCVDYTDMIWLPYEKGIVTANYFKFDYLFIDEAQDSSLAQQHLIDFCMKRNSRFFLFGDSFQMINAWAGSDEDAFKTFNKRANVKKFVLNISYRCPKTIAEKAREIVPDFEAYSNAIEGSINYNVSLSEIKPGDMVLCRLTAPLVKLYLSLIDKNVPVYIKGVEIGKEFINSINSFQTDDLDKVKLSLKENLVKTWEDVAELYQTDLKSVVGESDVVTIYDEILTLDLLSEGVNDKNELINKIKTLFIDKPKNISSEDKNFVHLSTVHRAKGLENDNVFILCPSLMPNKLAKKDWEIISEKNLVYVAWTRAKKTLNFISEKEFPPDKSYSGTDVLYKELNTIRENVKEQIYET